MNDTKRFCWANPRKYKLNFMATCTVKLYKTIHVRLVYIPSELYKIKTYYHIMSNVAASAL